MRPVLGTRRRSLAFVCRLSASSVLGLPQLSVGLPGHVRCRRRWRCRYRRPQDVRRRRRRARDPGAWRQRTADAVSVRQSVSRPLAQRSPAARRSPALATTAESWSAAPCRPVLPRQTPAAEHEGNYRAQRGRCHGFLSAPNCMCCACHCGITSKAFRTEASTPRRPSAGFLGRFCESSAQSHVFPVCFIVLLCFTDPSLPSRWLQMFMARPRSKPTPPNLLGMLKLFCDLWRCKMFVKSSNGRQRD